jgi:hypothetical protein
MLLGFAVFLVFLIALLAIPVDGNASDGMTD